MHDATRVLKAGLPAPSQGAPFLPGPTFAGAFHAAGDPADSPYTYGRFHNPTWTLFEQALAELEGGPALVFGSGMAAATAVFSTVLKRGDVLALPSDSYYTCRLVAQSYFAEQGIEVRMAPTAAGGQRATLAGARLLWLESPSNPGVDVCDIAALATEAHAAGALVAVDNTTATALSQRPLALGADFSIASDTKALTGHSDLILGHVATRDPALLEQLRTWRTRFGAVAGPMEVWLAHRSLGTLEMRLERQSGNALAVAQLLVRHPAVRSVRYPGLPEDPGHAVARRQMSRFGSVLNFTLADRAAAERFFAATTLVYEATSFGGLHTTAERRARWGGDPVPDGYIRMSVGCEAIEDLLEDLARGLDAAGAPGRG
jgi:cystathionine gamma-lyase